MKKFLFSLILSFISALCFLFISSCGEKNTESLEYEYSHVSQKLEYAVIGISDTKATEIYIPAEYKGIPVTEIKEGAFYGNKSIEKVEMTDNIRTIGKNAFKKCDNLQSVKLSNDLKVLDDETFAYCYKLSEIKMPSGLVSIKNSVFKSCSSLSTISLAGTMREIGENAFEECGLKLLTVPYNVKRIGDNAFAYSGIETLTLGGGLEIIADGAFSNCSLLKNLIIPDKVKTIGKQAFINCINLTDVILGKNVEEICDGAFYGCRELNGIIIPDWVKTVEADAFANCENLLTVTFWGQQITRIGEGAFRYCKIGAIEIPYSVEDIGQDAFKGCPCVKEIDGLSYVDKWLVKCDETLSSAEINADTVGIAHNAFLKCTALTEITLPERVKSIGRSAFYECFSLTKINVHPYNYKFISVNGNLFSNDEKVLVCAVSGKTETTFTVPEPVEEIREFAFNYCSALTTLYIPKTVKSFGDAAFYGCISLTDIYYGGTESQWQEIIKGTLWDAGVPKGYVVHFAEQDANGGTSF